MNIQQNIKIINNKIYSINPNAKLVAVTKKHSAEHINTAIAAGVQYIGENKWQEFESKFVKTRLIASLQERVKFHFIGHLQTNKVKHVVKYFNCIQSVDSFAIAQVINNECAKINKIIDIMVEVNVSVDENKHGIVKQNLKVLLPKLAEFKNINLIGFMTITALQDKKTTREDFRKMKQMFDMYKDEYGLTELSMGMSQDYEIALECGATLVRVGTKIFS
ncbi:MAG: YggS family pyridoxal phosphate-dependent enzyme [Patescibacteria group bacterium]